MGTETPGHEPGGATSLDIETSKDSELPELKQDVAPERVLDKIEETEQPSRTKVEKKDQD
ncbi:MAG: hypothetical protein AB1640_21520 [bacterium]